MKKEQEKLSEFEENKQSGEVSRRDFLVGAGTVVVGGAIGAGLLSSCDGGEKTVTTTVEKTKTVTTVLGDGATATVTETTSVGGGATITETKTVTSTGTGESIEPAFEEETSSLKACCIGGKGGCPAVVDVKNNKIVRIRPLHYDEKYTEDELSNTKWEYTYNGVTFKSRDRSNITYFDVGYKKRIYSPNRVPYPLKRVDWEPGGDPEKINPQNRGISKYKRISWDDAIEIVASEIKRIHDTYGVFGILLQGENGHHESKYIHQPAGEHKMLLGKAGGFTREVRNADSWEGWYWGATHVWGLGFAGIVSGAPAIETIRDTQMLINVSDRESMQMCEGSEESLEFRFITDIGKEQIFITPDLTYTGATHATKWIPVKCNTDSALYLAVMYTWIEEGTYDQEYLDTHCVGFDADDMPEGHDSKENLKDYILGTYDGIPKSPEWASPLCGVSEWTIKALAHNWANKTTGIFKSLWCGMRGAYGHEPARLQIYAMAMQGLGKPGTGHVDTAFPTTEGSLKLRNICRARKYIFIDQPQKIPRTMVADAIVNGTYESWGNTEIYAAAEDQFVKYSYPIDEADGGTEIHMIWSEKVCNTACWENGYHYIEAVRNPKIECYIANHQWLENDVMFSDIILPLSTLYEEDDMGGGNGVLFHAPPCIQHVGEGKSDYEIALLVAKKLEEYGGQYEGLYEGCSEGKSIEDWKRNLHSMTMLEDLCSYEQLVEKGYFCAPMSDISVWEAKTNGFKKFYEDPDTNALATPTGKIEIYSARLAEKFPDDKERGPLAKWVRGGPESEGWHNDEAPEGDRGELYPLIMMSPHPRWRHHVQADDITWIREIPTCKIKGYDGYLYEPIWLNTIDAEARGIKNGDIVKIYNDRGIVLGGAFVTERICPGAARQDHGARIDLITDGIDRGGSNNLICPNKGLSAKCRGTSSGSFLVQVEKLSGEEMQDWREKYPDAFIKDYDSASGLRATRCIEGGE